MKYFNIPALWVGGLLIIFTGCQSHDHSHDHPHGDEDHHGEGLTFTRFTDETELFIDISPLVKGARSEFAAHFTNLNDHSPVDRGQLVIQLLRDGQSAAEARVDTMRTPGIFQSDLTPSESGKYDMMITLRRPSDLDTFSVSQITVYSHDSDVPSDPGDSEEDISFTKEQAWKTEFMVSQVRRDDIHEVIRTSGKVVAPPEKETVVAATSNGLVAFIHPGLQVGSQVKAGQQLFSINSRSLLSSNTREKYRKAEAQLEMTRSNYERAQSLLDEDIIGRKEYERRKMEYEVAQAQWNTLSGHHGQNGSTITSPSSGVVTAIHIRPNEFVGEGAPLLEITNTERILIHAEISQKYLRDLPEISSANFKTAYDETVYSMEDHNGRLLSFGSALDQHEHFIPVWFELDRPDDLVIGAYLDVYLLAREKEDRVVIPVSALMQDYQMKYVFVQKSGESFEKREVRTGVSDGKNIEITSGLEAGERIVTLGAYQVKMASMSNSIPGHGHSH